MLLAVTRYPIRSAGNRFPPALLVHASHRRRFSFAISTNFLRSIFVPRHFDVRLYSRIMETASAGQEKDSAAAEETPDIFECAKEAEVQAAAKLASTFRKMVNDREFSDVTFLCSDGKRVYACRMILAGRSNVLNSMLMNGMAESNLSEIKSEMSSLVLLSIFEFLYTGTLIDYLPQSWRTACEVMVASRFFLLTELDMMIRRFMQTQIDSVADNLPKVASLLTEALEFEALCEQPDVILRVLVNILGSNLSDSTYIQSLSEDALQYFLAYSKGKSEDLDKLSFREYLRFRQVILWWFYQNDPGLGSSGTEELENLIPDLEVALSICRNQSSLELAESPDEDAASLSSEWNSLQYDGTLKNDVIRLLANIDYRCIHPVILAKVVKPLEISSAEVMSAFQFHALRRPMVRKTLEWGHGEFYDTIEQGYVIYRTGSGKEKATAVMNAAMSLPCGHFQWSFTIDELSETGFQLGFVNSGKSKDALKSKLDGARCYWAWFRGSDHVRAKHTIKNCIKANSPILFSFNAFEHRCSFSVIGKMWTWENLPVGIYYPALKLDHPFKGRVRIELVSGFDI